MFDVSHAKKPRFGCHVQIVSPINCQFKKARGKLLKSHHPHVLINESIKMSLKIVNKKKIHDYNAFLPLMSIERH
jgi:hypothetical protein